MQRVMKYRVLIITAMVLTAACISCTKNNPSQSIRMEINQAMQAQQDAWNRGDVEAFMQYYWNDDSLLFIGLKGPTYGWKTTLDNYKRGYDTPEKMGVLTFHNHRIDSLSPDAANVFGEWKIERTTETIGGYYTLIWSRKDQQWKITQDHTN
jgi:ketosteroid isomerase-like protein